ncbi:MAG: hypothetical protein Q8P32_03520 [Candidatus Komeilibacteria bacterium]|nr:hypothetical protein [Candidatus Komeilibacteria bacterium]
MGIEQGPVFNPTEGEEKKGKDLLHLADLGREALERQNKEQVPVTPIEVKLGGAFQPSGTESNAPSKESKEKNDAVVDESIPKSKLGSAFQK